MTFDYIHVVYNILMLYKDFFEIDLKLISPCFRSTPTGTMTVGKAVLVCTCCRGGIVEQYSLGLLGLGLGVVGTYVGMGLFFSKASATKKIYELMIGTKYVSIDNTYVLVLFY